MPLKRPSGAHLVAETLGVVSFGARGGPMIQHGFVAVVLVGSLVLPTRAAAQLVCRKTSQSGKVVYKLRDACKLDKGEVVAVDLSAPVDTVPDPLPSGKTVRGSYNLGGTAGTGNDLASTAVSFGFRLAAEPTIHLIQMGDPPPAECPGSFALPEASPGHLCIYEDSVTNTQGIMLNSVEATGATIFIRSNAAGDFFSFGTWAASAP